MKNILGYIILFVLVFTQVTAMASEQGNSDKIITEDLGQAIINEAKKQAEKDMDFYKKLYSCTPKQSTFNTIYGIENNKCHVKLSGVYNCFLPMNVARAYASAFFSQYAELEKGNLSTSSRESVYMQSVLQSGVYCKAETIYGRTSDGMQYSIQHNSDGMKYNIQHNFK